MDYGVVEKGAVPHISTLGQHFRIPYQSYLYSLILEISFIVLIFPLMGIWIYFSSKYKKPKTKKQNQQNNQQENGENVIEFEQGQDDRHSRTTSYKNKNMQEQYALESADKANSQQTKKKLQIVQRKICYGVCFFVLHVVAVNSFDAGILSITTFYVTLAFYALFNIIKPKKHVILQGLFILPAFASAFAYWTGKHYFGQHFT